MKPSITSSVKYWIAASLCFVFALSIAQNKTENRSQKIESNSLTLEKMRKANELKVLKIEASKRVAQEKARYRANQTVINERLKYALAENKKARAKIYADARERERNEVNRHRQFLKEEAAKRKHDRMKLEEHATIMKNTLSSTQKQPRMPTSSPLK